MSSARIGVQACERRKYELSSRAVRCAYPVPHSLRTTIRTPQTHAVMGFARLHASGDYWYIRCFYALEPTDVTAVS